MLSPLCSSLFGALLKFLDVVSSVPQLFGEVVAVGNFKMSQLIAGHWIVLSLLRWFREVARRHHLHVNAEGLLHGWQYPGSSAETADLESMEEIWRSFMKKFMKTFIEVIRNQIKS